VLMVIGLVLINGEGKCFLYFLLFLSISLVHHLMHIGHSETFCGH